MLERHDQAEYYCRIYLEKIRINAEKLNMKVFKFLSKIAPTSKIFDHGNFNLSLSRKYNFFGDLFVKNWIIKLYFYLPSNFVYMFPNSISGGIDNFSVNQLENDTSGNKKIGGYC